MHDHKDAPHPNFRNIMNDPSDPASNSRLAVGQGAIQQLKRDFERQWQSGLHPRIETYLDQVASESRGELLDELLAVELL